MEWVRVENRGLNRGGLWLPQGDARAPPRQQNTASGLNTQGPWLGNEAPDRREPAEKASSGQTNPDAQPRLSGHPWTSLRA